MKEPQKLPPVLSPEEIEATALSCSASGRLTEA
jgi:hypothetical protein